MECLVMNSINEVLRKVLMKFFSKINHPENIELKLLFSSYKKCLILGSAPSINKLNLKNIDEDTLVITMGNFHEHPDIETIKPHIHIFAASHPPITKTVLEKWFTRANDRLPKDTFILIETKDFELSQLIFNSRKLYKYSYHGSLPIDFTKRIIAPWSVTQIAIQFSIYLGIKNTYLLGVNHNWQSNKPYKHFFTHDKPSLEFYLNQENIEVYYEKPEEKISKDRLYKSYELYQIYEQLKIEALKKDLNIYNGDMFSEFDVYEKKNFIEIKEVKSI